LFLEKYKSENQNVKSDKYEINNQKSEQFVPKFKKILKYCKKNSIMGMLGGEWNGKTC